MNELAKLMTVAVERRDPFAIGLVELLTTAAQTVQSLRWQRFWQNVAEAALLQLLLGPRPEKKETGT